MHKFLHILEHSLLDSLKILPILLIVYFLIEFLEYKQAGKLNNLKFLNKKSSSIFGALFGSLPQCGFSVIATDLYTKRKINIGALIAVYIATSDEALPILISNFSSIKVVLPLLIVKILIAIVVGGLTQLVFDNIITKKPKLINETAADKRHNDNLISSKTDLENSGVAINNEKTNGEKISESVDEDIHGKENSLKGINQSENNIHIDEHSHEINIHEHIHNEEHSHEHGEHNEKALKTNSKMVVEEIHSGCCHHDIEHKRFDWKHPLLHSLKIIGIIFIINILFGCLIEFGFKGEENLKEFLTSNSIYWLQPLLAMLVGFIPNCASSVVLTELYVIGALSFGSLVAGLVVNAGLGLILLFKQNRNVKENLIIVSILMFASLAFGYFLHFII